MEPRIQYAKTSDGVSIAYWTYGEGRPLLITPPLTASHLTWEWQIPALREWYIHLARGRTVIRYDQRCMGLSDRGVLDVSQAAAVLDVEAVVEGLDMREIDIIAFAGPAIVALEFASSYPQLVRKLVLIEAMARWAEYLPPEQLNALTSLAQQDWQLFRETYARAQIGWSSGSEAHAFAEFLAASMEPEDAVRRIEAWRKYDATPCLSQVEAQTLVIAFSKHPVRRGSLVAAREIAAAVPQSILLNISFEAPEFYAGPRLRQAVDEFLEIAPAEKSSSQERPIAGSTAVILFADIADSTGLTEQLGDVAFRDRSRALDESLRTLIREVGGRPVEGKLLGDGLMAVFTSAREAIECALRCNATSDAADLRLHLGLHAGDVIHEADNVYGGAVNIASRVAGEAAAGETLVSATVRDLARTSAGVSFDDRGDRQLKGVAEPQRVYEVRWREE